MNMLKDNKPDPLNTSFEVSDDCDYKSVTGYSLHTELDIKNSSGEETKIGTLIADVIANMKDVTKKNKIMKKKRKRKNTDTEDPVNGMGKLGVYSTCSESDTSSSTRLKVKKEKIKLDKPIEESSGHLNEKSSHKPKKKKKKRHIPEEGLSHGNKQLGIFSSTLMDETVTFKIHNSSSDSENVKKNKRKRTSSGNHINGMGKLQFYSSVSKSDTSNGTRVKVKKEKRKLEIKEDNSDCLTEKSPHKPKNIKKLHMSEEELSHENGLLRTFSPTFMDETMQFNVHNSSSDSEMTIKKKKRKRSSTDVDDHINTTGNSSVSGNNTIMSKPKKKNEKPYTVLEEQFSHVKSHFMDLSDKSDSDSDEEESPKLISSSPRSVPRKKIGYMPPDFEVPQLHKILNRASKPDAQQRALIQLKEIEVQYGKYLKREDQQILENWQHFIEVNNLPDDPTRFSSLSKKLIHMSDKHNFLYYLARNMPKRTPYGVFTRFKLLVLNRKKGKFSKEEDEYIMKKFSKKKTEKHWGAVNIAKKLNRSVQSVHKRIEVLENKLTRKIKFKGKNAATFIKYLLKATGIPKYDIEQLKGRTISPEEWAILSKKLDNIPVRILQKIWMGKLHPALFIPDDVNDIADVKYRLIQLVSSNNETEWKSTSWAKYVPHFEGFTALRLYMLMNQLVLKYVPAEKRHDLKKCVKTLLKVKREDLQSRPIYKIVYENGTVSQRSTSMKKLKENDV